MADPSLAELAPPPDADDTTLAAWLALEAGRLLVDVRVQARAAGLSPWQLGDEGDGRAHNWLMAQLAEHRPADAVLSEEGTDDRLRLDHDRVWIIDPLDGSRDYGSAYSNDYAVHVALTVNGQPASAAVSVPEADRVFSTAVPQAHDPGREIPNVVASRAQAHWGRALAQEFGGDVTIAGSAGVKAMTVVVGEADIYVHPTGLYEWDVCAPAAVAAAAGLSVFGFEGGKLDYNQEYPVVPGLVIARPRFAEEVLKLLNG